MVKHNNVVPNGHFHKDWQRRVRTWFDQPARKTRRYQTRKDKTVEIAPRPLKPLQPLVQGQTIKYNRIIRAGRGFTILELKQVGLTPKFARTVGIKVDHRRRNRSQEVLTRNVQKLELYKSKMTLYPLRKEKPKKGQINDAVL